jgi:autotransporter-associated beta strand protein
MAITAQPQPTSADPGGTVTLTMSTTGPSPAIYQWRRNGSPIGPASQSPTLTLSNVSGGAEGVYDCVFTTTLGTLVSEGAAVTLNGIGAIATGGLWREVFTGIGGNAVSNMTENAKFPFFADSSGVITSAASPSSFADSYGQRWTGWIRPQVSGNYRFYLSSDDDSELWLSPNELPTEAVRILTLSGYTNEKQWSARSPSAYIPLIAGVRYAIEVRHKDGGGGDHCALAWQRQGDAAPVNGSGEIPGTVLEHRVGGLFADTDFALENQPPVFASNPLVFPPATALVAYAGGTLAAHAADPDQDDVLAFAKVSGPAWLSVATNGMLGGTPSSDNAGENSFSVRVTDASGRSVTTTLLIEVSGADFHFDHNGPLAGSGAGGGGAWGGAAAWSADPLGESASFGWVDGASALFSAGDDANDIYQISLDGVKTVGAFVARTGEPRLTGGGLIPAAADTPFAVLTAAARIDSPVSGSSRGIVKTGPGTLTLGGNNTYSGNTLIEAGTLRIGIGTSSGDIGSGAVGVAPNATLEFHLQSSHLRDYKTTAKMRTVSGSGGILLDGGFTFFNFPGTGGGFAESNSWNDFSGTLTVTGGSEFRTIRNGRTAMGSGQVILGDAAASGHLAQIEGNWTWTNDIRLAGPANQIRNRSVTAPRTLKLQGVISGSGGLTFADTTGAMNQINRGFILSGANTLDGTVTIPSGVPVRVGGIPGDADVNQSAAGNSGSLGTAAIVNHGTLTFSRTNAHTVENHISGAGTLRFGIPATAGFGDTTSQLITYTGSASHTGTTTVHNGALVIANGASLGGATVTVETTGSLGGSGTVNAPLIIQSGAVLAPSPNAMLRTGPLTLAAGAEWHVATAGGIHGSMVLVNGNAVLNGAHLVVAEAPTGTTRVLLQYSGTRIGEFNASESTLPDGWEITYHDDLGEVRLSAIAPPGGYVSWIASYETGGLDGFGDDADYDGIANGLEFVLHGGDPLTPRSAKQPWVSTDAQGGLRFTFLRAARARSHASILVELSDDLTSWPEPRQLAVGETTATSDTGVEVIPHEDHDEISVALPQDAPRTFVRIRVIE